MIILFEKNRNVKNSFEYRVKLNHWEKNLTMTFLDLKDIKKLFSKFKDVKIGIEEFNFTNFKKKNILIGSLQRKSKNFISIFYLFVIDLLVTMK